MDIFQAVVLGVAQGLTEMLPISSSGHLVLIPWIFGWKDPGLTFDVSLHVGTIISVIAYFWRDWLMMLRSFGRFLVTRKIETFEQKLFWIIAVASVPGAAAGFFLEKQAETGFREPLQIGALMIGMGILLWVADKWPERAARKAAEKAAEVVAHEAPASDPKEEPVMVADDGGSQASGSKEQHIPNEHGRPIESIGFKQGLLIGGAQALAIMPGVSRSGATMTAGLFTGLSRDAVARFSFLMSAPIIFGAAAYQLGKMFLGIDVPAGEASGLAAIDAAFIAGCLASALVGFLAIKFLLQYLRSHNFTIFVVYRLAFGAFIIGLALFRG